MRQLIEEYFTRSVTELADRVPVTTCQDVMSTTGLKLVNKGVRLDSSFSEKLCQHSIRPPLEQCLVVQQGVDNRQIEDIAGQLMGTFPPAQRMAVKMQGAEKLLEVLRQIPLSDPAIFLLTLARERRPALLRHGVLAALVCIYLGSCRGLKPQQLLELAIAGLFHDIGELRIDSRLLKEDAHPAPQQREQIFTHPATSQRMLLNAGVYPIEAVNAVMRHHECLDGSGFPFGLMGSEMGELAKILSLAEVIVTRLNQEEQDGKPWLELMVKFNMQKYDAALLPFVSVFYEREMLNRDEVPTLDLVSITEIHEQIETINLALEFWRRLLGDIPVRQRSAAAYIHQRITALAKATREAGIDTTNKDEVTNLLDGDDASLLELSQINRETLRQITETVYEVMRRWPDYQSDPSLLGQVVSGWMEYMQEMLLEKHERMRVLS